MEFNQKVADALIADTDEFIVYWDCKKGWSCSENGCESLCREPIRKKGMLGLLDIVQDHDRELCSLFLNIMQQGSKDAKKFQPLSGKRKEVNLHLRGGMVHISIIVSNVIFRKNERRALWIGAGWRLCHCPRRKFIVYI